MFFWKFYFLYLANREIHTTKVGKLELTKQYDKQTSVYGWWTDGGKES